MLGKYYEFNIKIKIELFGSLIIKTRKIIK